MTDAFRQKLLNWFISILLLLAATAAMLLVHWFVRAPLVEESPYISRGALIAVTAGEILILYAVLFFPILIWHLLDFAERSNALRSSPLEMVFVNHTVLVVTMGISQITGVLIATGMAEWNSCDDLPDMVYPHSCRLSLEWWALILFFGPLLFSFILCIGRAVITIRSRLIKVQ